MKNCSVKLFICLFVLSAVLLVGCGQKQPSGSVVHAAASIQAAPETLKNVTVTLPGDMTRKEVSALQHDFTREGRQVGGIVLVDIPDAMLDEPFGNFMQITERLNQQLMPEVKPALVSFLGAGGSDYAYMELSTGEEDLHYLHNLIRGDTACYDVWFDVEALEFDAVYDILATVSSQDIRPENNKSPF